MCMFCAAIPASVALGAAVTGKQKLRDQQVQNNLEATSTPRRLLAGKVSVAITGGLIVCSVVYHLVIMPQSGAVV